VLDGVFPQTASPFEVFIQSYEVVPSEYERGPLYKLSPRDLERFEGALEQRVGAGMQIVGFFRSHTRKGLGLDTEDVAILNKFFPKQYQVALLAKPFATKLTAGAIFIREGRSLRSESSYKEFHFRTSKVERRGALVATLKGGEKASPAPAAAEPMTVADAPTEAEPDTWTGWAPTVVPIKQDSALPGGDAPRKRRSFGLIWIAVSAALKGTIGAAKPTCIATSAKLAAAVRAAQAICMNASTKLVATLETARPIYIAACGKLATATRVARPICVTASVKLTTAVRAVRPMWITASGKLPATIRAARPMWIVGAGAAGLAVWSGLLFFPGLHRTKRPATTSSRNTSTLSLRVERSAGELHLTWNGDADVIHEATHAVLAITDGERHQSVNLDRAQLRHGGLLYLSYNPEVDFQLKVTGRKPSQTQSEFVRVLRISPWATPEPPAASPPKPVPMRTSAANAIAHMSSKVSKGSGADLAKAPNESAPQADYRAQNSGSASPLDLPDAPVLTFGPQAPVNMASPAGIQLSPFQLSVIAPPHIPEPRVGGQVSEAQILTQTSPEYPLAARQARAQGSVVVRAVIGVNGHVKLAKALSGPPLLQNPAVAAVRRWVYKPSNTEWRRSRIGDANRA